MADQTSRVGLTFEVELLATASQDHAASAILDCEPEIEAHAYRGKSASADMFMETDGAPSDAAFPGYMAWADDEATDEVDLFFEMGGSLNGSMVFSYVLDTGSEQVARLLQQNIEGQPTPSERLFWFAALDADYTIYSAYGEAETPATADAVFLLKRKREGVTTTVATMTFIAGQDLPEIVVIDSSVAVGDRLSFHAPALQDDTLSDLLVAFVLIFA